VKSETKGCAFGTGASRDVIRATHTPVLVIGNARHGAILHSRGSTV